MEILKNGIDLNGRFVLVLRILSDRPQLSDIPGFGLILNKAVYDISKREPCPYSELGKVAHWEGHLNKGIILVSWLMPNRSIESAFAHLDDILIPEGSP